MGEITIKKFEENIIELKEKSERLAPQYFWNVIKVSIHHILFFFFFFIQEIQN